MRQIDTDALLRETFCKWQTSYTTSRCGQFGYRWTWSNYHCSGGSTTTRSWKRSWQDAWSTRWSSGGTHALRSPSLRQWWALAVDRCCRLPTRPSTRTSGEYSLREVVRSTRRKEASRGDKDPKDNTAQHTSLCMFDPRQAVPDSTRVVAPHSSWKMKSWTQKRPSIRSRPSS